MTFEQHLVVGLASVLEAKLVASAILQRVQFKRNINIPTTSRYFASSICSVLSPEYISLIKGVEIGPQFCILKRTSISVV